MKYPEWAPLILAELCKSRVDNESTGKKHKVPDPVPDLESIEFDVDSMIFDPESKEFVPESMIPDSMVFDPELMDFVPKSMVSDPKSIASSPESLISDSALKQKGMTKEGIENLRLRIDRLDGEMPCGLPEKESTALLEQLITDIRMKDVWKALAKRTDEDYEFFLFFKACEAGILGWRHDLKQTASERKAFYQEIRDTSAKLFSLLNKADQFDLYTIDSLYNDKKIEWLMESLDVPPYAIPHARSRLAEIMPSIYQVLINISEEAAQYGKEESSVKHPNSPNAEIHHFIRLLSGYCQYKFKQPLHEVVAITASVIFNQQNIDDDNVRKLVKR